MSQPNTITVTESLVPETPTTVYTSYDYSSQAHTYVTIEHEPKKPDSLVFRRNLVPGTGIKPGFQVLYVQLRVPALIKATDGSDISETATFSLECKVPAGITPADVLVLRSRMIAVLQDTSVMTPLIHQMMI